MASTDCQQLHLLLPINASLWAYLIRRLSDEAYKDNKPTISRQGTAQVMLQIGSCQNKKETTNAKPSQQ